MDRNPLTKLADLARKFKVVGHLKRQEFLVDLVTGMIRSRSVIFSEIGDKMDKDILPDSVERRIQDFFQKVAFDYEQLLALLLCFVPHQKVCLSMDRTEWDHGQQQYNILCIIASVGKMGVPLYFELLDNNSGNSNTGDRIALLKEVIHFLGPDRIEVLVMDREFIGQKWLHWLKEQRIPFCVRVPKSHLIMLADGIRWQAERLFHGNARQLLFQQVIVDGVVVNLSLSRAPDGDLLFLIGTIPAAKLKATYRRRWTIEVFFQALKGRGFDIERTGLRCPIKLRKLFAVACLAYSICWATGIEEGKQNPVKPKKHGYPQYSVFRRGLNLLRQALKSGVCQALDRLWELVFKRMVLLPLKTVG